jgi:hypothetical protein
VSRINCHLCRELRHPKLHLDERLSDTDRNQALTTVADHNLSGERRGTARARGVGLAPVRLDGAERGGTSSDVL